MSHFVYDQTSLSEDKSDLTPIPVGADPTKYIQAVEDWNPLTHAVLDLRDVLLGAEYIGFTTQTTDPHPAGIGTYIWVRNDANIVLHQNGSNYTFLTTARTINTPTNSGLQGGGPLTGDLTLSMRALSPDPTGTWSQVTVNSRGQVTAGELLLLTLQQAYDGWDGTPPAILLDSENGGISVRAYDGCPADGPLLTVENEEGDALLNVLGGELHLGNFSSAPVYLDGQVATDIVFVQGSPRLIYVARPESGDEAGGSLSLEAANGHGTGAGGDFESKAGSGAPSTNGSGGTGSGGSWRGYAGDGGNLGGSGGNMELYAGDDIAGDDSAGYALLQGGSSSVAGGRATVIGGRGSVGGNAYVRGGRSSGSGTDPRGGHAYVLGGFYPINGAVHYGNVYIGSEETASIEVGDVLNADQTLIINPLEMTFEGTRDHVISVGHADEGCSLTIRAGAGDDGPGGEITVESGLGSGGISGAAYFKSADSVGGTGGVVVGSGGCSGEDSVSGPLTLSTGDSEEGNSGDIGIDVGAAGNPLWLGVVNIGHGQARALNLGRNGKTTTVSGNTALGLAFADTFTVAPEKLEFLPNGDHTITIKRSTGSGSSSTGKSLYIQAGDPGLVGATQGGRVYIDGGLPGEMSGLGVHIGTRAGRGAVRLGGASPTIYIDGDELRFLTTGRIIPEQNEADVGYDVEVRAGAGVGKGGALYLWSGDSGDESGDVHVDAGYFGDVGGVVYIGDSNASEVGIGHLGITSNVDGVFFVKSHSGFPGSGSFTETAKLTTADGDPDTLWFIGVDDTETYWLEAWVVATDGDYWYSARVLAQVHREGGDPVLGNVYLEYQDPPGSSWSVTWDVLGENVRLRVAGAANWVATVRHQAVKSFYA